jgi:phage gp29-like protein
MDKTSKLTTKGMGKEIGGSGTLIYSGIITAEEYNRSLTGRNAIDTYETMRRSDATVKSLLLVCKLPIIRAVWDVKPASEDAADEEIAEFIKDQLFNGTINFTDHLREALTMLDFGHDVHEKVYAPVDHEGQLRIGIAKLGYRKQKSIQAWEMTNHQPGIRQQLSDKVVDIPLAKLIVYTYDKEGENHEGISILRAAFKDWDMKDKLGLVLPVGLEKMAIPTPVLGVPAGADEREVSNAIEALRQFRANEEAYIKKPTGWELEKFDLSGQTTKEILPTLQYYDRQIVRSVLAQFLELGSSDGSGSRALSEDHSRLFQKSLEAVAKIIRDSLQNQLITQLCDLNYTSLPNGYPKLEFDSISDDNVTTVSDAVQKLMNAGALTADNDIENAMRRMLNFPELADDYVRPEKEPLPEDTKKLVDPKDEKKKAIRAAESARKNLIDILVRE